MQGRYKRSWMWLQRLTHTPTHRHSRIWATRQRRAEWRRWQPATRVLTRLRTCSTTTPHRGQTSSGRTASCRGSWPVCIEPLPKVRSNALSLYFLRVTSCLLIFSFRRRQRRAAGGRGLRTNPVPGAEWLRGLRQGAAHRLPGGQQAGAEALAAGWRRRRLQPGLDALPAACLPVGGTTVRPDSIRTFGDFVS